MKICPFCGKENSDASRFCAQCGSRIEGVGQTPADQQSDDLYEYPPTSWKQAPYAGDDQGQYQNSYNQNDNSQTGYDQTGYTQAGYDQTGYTQAGYDQSGYTQAGYDQSGYARTGYDQSGYTQAGYDQTGYTQTGYDQSDYSQNSYAQNGYGQNGNSQSSYSQGVNDRDGYERSGNMSGNRSKRPGRNNSDEDKKTILIGVILAVIVGVVGIGAYFVVTGLLNKNETSNRETVFSQSSTATANAAAESADTEKEEDPEEESTPEPTAEITATATPTPTPTPASSNSTADLTTISSSALRNYSKAVIKSSQASSVVDQAGYDNDPDMMVDGDTVTSWQEGAPGDGTGEWVRFELSQTYNIKYIVFNLGNWRDQARYDQNNRPKSMTIRLGEQEFDVTFPDGKKEFCVEFSDPCSADEIYLEINSAYVGTLPDNDCCISEMTVYTE